MLIVLTFIPTRFLINENADVLWPLPNAHTHTLLQIMTMLIMQMVIDQYVHAIPENACMP